MEEVMIFEYDVVTALSHADLIRDVNSKISTPVALKTPIDNVVIASVWEPHGSMVVEYEDMAPHRKRCWYSQPMVLRSSKVIDKEDNQ
jgi:hypothetical protein